MGSKESGIAFVNDVHNEIVQTRTDQRMMAEDLTQRINGVANQVKRLDARIVEKFEQVDKRFEQVDKQFEQVDKRLDRQDGRLATLEKGQTQMLDILVAIQRKLDVN